MKGNDEVIRVLGEVLSAELTAITQYMVHAEMCANWQYQRLAAHIKKDAIEEMKHAEELIERILYLEGAPDLARFKAPKVGMTVAEQRQLDLELEYDAVARLNPGIELCRAKGDNGTRVLLDHILKDEERHIDWIESQLQQIKDLGIQNYLAEQSKE